MGSLTELRKEIVRLRLKVKRKWRIEEPEKRVLDVERQRDQALDKLKEEKEVLRQMEGQLEEERGKNQKSGAVVSLSGGSDELTGENISTNCRRSATSPAHRSMDAMRVAW